MVIYQISFRNDMVLWEGERWKDREVSQPFFKNKENLVIKIEEVKKEKGKRNKRTKIRRDKTKTCDKQI